MTVQTPPTCEDLWGNDDYERVHREVDDGWRHGCCVADTYVRVTDGTYWTAMYQRSTDGETNGLREGDAEIIQVRPVEKIIIDYVPVDGCT